MVYLSQDYIGELPKTHTSVSAFDLSALPRDPNELFTQWFEEAVAQGIGDLSAVTVATVDEHGMPDARMVDIISLDEKGFHFGTSAKTAKVSQLEQVGAAAMCFWWQPLRRAVRVRGSAARDFDGERLNVWCVKPEHFEFTFLWDDRLHSDRVIYTLDEFGHWDRIRLQR